MLTENDVVKLLAEYLRNNGYSQIRTLTTLQQGIDLTATSPTGKMLMVEAKGGDQQQGRHQAFWDTL